MASMLARFRLAATIAVAAAVIAIGLQASAQPVQAVQSVCATHNCATLSVGADGPGSGTITTDDGVIKCVHSHNIDSGVCSEQLVWSLLQGPIAITITATAAEGSTVCYSSSCQDSPRKYADLFYGGDARDLTVSFALHTHALTVGLGGTGTGSVSSPSGPISCPSNCSLSADYGTKITLTAKPGTGKFKAWTGSCAGQGATCQLTLTADMVTIAEFDLPSSAVPSNPLKTTDPAATSGSSLGTAAPGSSVLADAASPASSGSAMPSDSAAASGDPSPAAPGGSDSPPWLPIIALGVLAVVGVNLAVWQVLRSRSPRS